jgi:putative FmdB family regulatory protein
MPFYDFRCKTCEHVFEVMQKWDAPPPACPECDNASKKVFLKLAKPNYLAMGAQANVSPEFQDRFDKMHRKQAEKEKAFEKEHGEGQYYNRAPGS